MTCMSWNTTCIDGLMTLSFTINTECVAGIQCMKDRVLKGIFNGYKSNVESNVETLLVRI